MSLGLPRVIAAVVAVGVLAGCGSFRAPQVHGTGAGGDRQQATVDEDTEPAPDTAPVRSKPAAARITYPADGSRRWLAAAGQTGPASGQGGTLLRYRVLVERDIKGLPAATFATAVAATLGADDGWTAGGQWRFKRVGPGQAYDFTLYLATPDTRDELCRDVPDGYTSCRSGDKVVLNVARWVEGVPSYGKNLASYRRYMVNHEVGHRLGHGHELCPGPGEPAPVMQQQTLGLHGCQPNDAPYVDGESYHGPSGAYPDGTPEREKGRK
ncbi:DUF3152 domain-containing protein [Symbioplanes lichenis]|uniref:DUF3152 domain-containing protein n=1 Tax=Symbioplanes lichenis TaxID=1629072 RepID=UPI002738E9B5|nr:DUF3152 domain-containing protein [Actinoplanes lichenis]